MTHATLTRVDLDCPVALQVKDANATRHHCKSTMSAVSKHARVKFHF